MRAHSHRSLAPGPSWRAVLLALGLGLPASAAEPEKPKPTPAELFRQYVENRDEGALQALSALGPDAAITILSTPLEEVPPQEHHYARRSALHLLEPHEERLVRLFRALGSNNESAARFAASLLECNDVDAPLLERAVKNPVTVKEARRLLTHPTPRVRHLAAVILAAAGERGRDVQVSLKWAIRDCSYSNFERLLEPGAPEDLSKSLVLATTETSAEGQRAVAPRLVYRKGSWEPIIGPIQGPTRWFPLASEPKSLQTEARSALLPSGCDTTFWGLRMTGERVEEMRSDVAFSRKVELQPVQPAPTKLQAAIQAALKRQAPAELRLMTQQTREQEMADQKSPNTWTPAPGPLKEDTWCRPHTGTEWLCYTRQEHELRARTDEPPDTTLCVSRLWLRGNDTQMRILHAERDCHLDERDLSRERLTREPKGVLELEGRTWWLLFIDFGPGAYELWEARADGMKLATPISISYQWAACD